MEGGGVGASATGEIRELDVRIVSLDVAGDRFRDPLGAFAQASGNPRNWPGR